MSTALVPTKPSFMRRLAAVFQRTPADLTRTLVGNANAGGWSIVRGQTPSDFQGTGEEVRLRGWERHPVVHACIRAIADLVAAVPLEIIDRPPGEADAKVLPNHEALALFRGENGGESEFRFKARTATHFLTYGNAFSVMERNGIRGLPRWLRVIQPTAVQYVWLDPKTDMIRLYDWRDLQGTVHAGTPAENMLHFRDLDATDGLFGFPRGAAALRAIMADSEASEYVRQIVTNHGLPGLVVLVDGSPIIEELQAGEDRFREKWVSRGNRGGTSFMAGVKDLKQLAFSLADLEFPDLRATTREDICVAFNVDRRIIGVSSGTSDGGLSGEQFREARFRLIQQAVYPVMRCLEDEINRVLTPEYGEVWCRFSEEYIAAITEDVTQTSARVVSELNAKIRTVEESRDAIGLDVNMKPTDHLPGGLTVKESQDNAAAMGAAAIEAAQNPAPVGAFGGRAMLTRAMRLDKDEASALWGKFDETARKQEGPYERTALILFMLEAEGVARVLLTLAAGEAIASDPFIAAALARIEADYAPGAAYHKAWLDRYTKLITQTVKLGGSDVASQIGIDFALENPRAQAVIRQRAADLVTNVTETTRQSIREAILAGRTEGLSVSEMAKRIQDTTFGEIGAARAQTIARTECLPADAVVDGARITALYRRSYDGELVEITTRTGRKIAGTPNHPVLTVGGWRGLGELTEGDDLICDALDVERTSAAGDEHVEHPPATIAEIFNAALAVVIPERERTTQPDFHGDGCEGEVDVLRPDSVLLLGDFAPIDEGRVKRVLSPSDMGAVLLAASRAPFRRDLEIDTATGFGHGTPRNTSVVQYATDNIPVDADLLRDRLRRCARLIRRDDLGDWDIEPEPGSAMALPEVVGAGRLEVAGDTRLSRETHYALGTGVEFSGDAITAPALAVQLDGVLRIERRRYVGHVFNLTTVDGYFVAGGIYTSNTVGALNAGAYQAATQSNLMRSKEWLTQGDDRVRDSHVAVNGERVDIGATFSNGLRYPHDPLGPPEETINCRCTTLFSDLEATAT